MQALIKCFHVNVLAKFGVLVKNANSMILRHSYRIKDMCIITVLFSKQSKCFLEFKLTQNIGFFFRFDS
jgi:hypothetical protein